ncbi:cytoskeletal protein CcmA (bactofilin family) [Alteromonadaceae bacterium 2753L.S.0a.02]|nr:cytoskeletal protein CcmA (bactofilin family) [Alteromonadaceae bacterium 2753L.S.0a.02]
MRGFKNSDTSKPISDFSKGDSMSATPISQPASVATPVSEASSRPVATQQQSAPSAVIGSKIRFKGELVGEEDLLIQGQVDGTIDLKNHSLIIGSQGTVKANVLAKTVTIEGTVEGDLFGQERISILASSNVKGNIVAERVILEDGAKFRGSIDMDVEHHKDKLQGISGSSSSSSSSPTFTKPAASSPEKSKPSETV